MSDQKNGKIYDLEERSHQFAAEVRKFVRRLPRTISNSEDVRQVVRSSGSIGANYIEANESLGRKDFLLHIKISRREAKESRHWLRLLFIGSDSALEESRQALVQEAAELMSILGAIFQKSQDQKNRRSKSKVGS